MVGIVYEGSEFRAKSSSGLGVRVAMPAASKASCHDRRVQPRDANNIAVGPESNGPNINEAEVILDFCSESAWPTNAEVADVTAQSVTK